MSKEVGQLSIRVRPDTSRFREELETQLKAATAGVDEDAEVGVDLDAKGLTQQVKAAAQAASGEKVKVGVESDTVDLDRFQKRLIADLRRIGAKAEATIPLTLDGESLRRQLQGLEKAAVLQISTTLELDNAEATRQRNEFQRSVDYIQREAQKAFRIQLEPDFVLRNQGKRLLDRIQALRPEVTVDLQSERLGKKIFAAVDKLRPKLQLDIDTRRLGEKIKSAVDKAVRETNQNRVDLQPGVIQQRIAAGAGGDLPVNVELDFAVAEAQLAAYRAAAASRKISVALRPELEGRYVIPQIEQLKFKLKEILRVPIEPYLKDSKLGAAFARIKAQKAFFEAEDAAKALANGLGEVGSSAARQGPKLLSFASVLLAVVAAVAILLPPLLALAAGFITLAPALLALTVPIGVIALGLDGIKKAAERAKPAFEELKKQISGVFETGLAPGFDTIGQKLIPALTEPLKGVASSLSGMFNTLATELAGPSLGNIRSIIDNVGAGIANATPGVRDFAAAIIDLVEGISQKFPGLGTWFSELGAKFRDFIVEFTSVKDENGLTGLERTIAGVRKGIEGLTGVFQAFWGNAFKDIQSGAFGDKMLSFFRSIEDFVKNTLPGLTQGFQAFADLLNNLAPAFKIITPALDALAKAGALLAGTPEQKGQAVKDIGKDWFGFGKDDADPKASQALIDQNAVTQQAAAVAVAAKQEFDKTIASMPVDQQKSLISAALGDDAVAQSQWGAKLATAASSARDGITAQFDGVKAAVEAKWLEINAAVTTGIQGMQTTISTFFTALPVGFTGAFTGVQQSITGMFALITLSIGTQSANITNSFQTAFSSIGPAIGTALSNVPAAITGALTGIRGAVDTSMSGAAQAAADGGLQVAAAAQASFGTVPAAVTIGMSPAVVSVSTVCSQMVSTALSFAGAMEQSGVAIGASFAAGLASTAGLVANSASALMGAARAFFPNSPAAEGPFSGSGWVDKSGEAIGDSFALGIDNSAGGVVGVAKQMMQAVKDVFGDASGLTLNFNLGATAMSSMASDAASFKGSMEGAAASLNTVSVPSNVGGGKSGNNFAGKVDEQTKGELDVLKYQQEYLDLQRQSLQLQTNGASKAQEAELKRQMDILSLQKDRIGLQAKELEYWSKYQDTSRDMDEQYAKAGEKLQTMGTDFARATGQQFMSDLGMSGTGAIPNLLDQGSQYIFQVLDVQSALTGQQTLQNKKAQQFTGGM